LSSAGATWSVFGNTNTTGPVTFGTSSVTTITSLQTLRLDGGGLGSNQNAMAGGTINGPGTVAANAGRALNGFGTIAAPVDFDGSASLLADDGTLQVTGTLVDVGTIGTKDVDGVLNVVNPWNTNVADFVSLSGGTLQGGLITNNGVNGIS